MYKLIIHLHPTHIIIHLITSSKTRQLIARPRLSITIIFRSLKIHPQYSANPMSGGPRERRWCGVGLYGGIILLVLIAWVALPTHHCLVMLLLLPLRLFCPFSFMCVRTFYFAEDQIRMRHVHVSNLRGARTPHDFVCQRTLSNLRAAPPKIRHQIDKIKHSRYYLTNVRHRLGWGGGGASVRVGSKTGGVGGWVAETLLL